jgi:uncharacterized protein YuzE
MERVSMIDFRYDAAADAAYIHLAASSDHGGVGRTIVTDVELDRAAINMDFGADGFLLGIEVLGASRVLAQEILGKHRADP